MKRFYLSFIALILFIALLGCETQTIKLEEVKDGIALSFTSGDDYNSVTNHITIIVDEKISKAFEIEWQSSNPEVATIKGSLIEITRSYVESYTVTITATFTYEGTIETKTFTFVVAQKPDDLGPIVSGFHNYYQMVIGDPKPDYLEGVTAVDAISNPSTLSIDDSAVDYSTPGTYVLYIVAKDTLNNETKVNISVHVMTLEVFEVTFIDGESTLSTQTVTEREPLSEPTAPIKEGYDFVGWFTDPDFTIAYTFNRLLTTDLVLYAKFELTVIPDTTGPTIYGTSPFTYYIGDPIPNYLALVYAVDDVSGDVNVTVSDQLINYTVEGSYTLTYRALDEAQNLTTVNVTVTVLSKPVQTAIVETFDNIGALESSYLNDGFTGVNNIAWTYIGGRTDQTLNGKAFTFGANANNALKATISGGIAGFSMSAKPVFSGAEPRNIALYINDVLVETFAVTSTQPTYQVTGLNVSGTYTFELRNTGGLRVIIDDLSITPNNAAPELRLLQQDADALQLTASFLSAGTLILPTQGLNNSTIAYGYAQNNPNNSLINLATGQVTMPSSGQVTVGIKATLTLSTYTLEKTFQIKVGEGDPITVCEAKSVTGLVKTKGIVSAVVVETNYIRVFLEDNTDAIQVLLPKQGFTVTPGEEIIIKGTMNQGVLSEVTSLVSNGVKTIYVTEVTYEDLSSLESSLVVFVGLVQKDYTTGLLYVVTESGVIPVINKTAQTSPWINAKLGQEIVIIGNVVKENNQYIVWVTDVLDTEIRPYDEDLLFDFIVDVLGLLSPQTVAKDMDLPTIEPLFNVPISWVSSHPNVVSNTGVFTKPSDRTELTLTFTIDFPTFDLQGIIVVVAEGAPTLSNYYISAQGLSGSALKSELNRIISNAKSSSYDAAKTILSKADVVPSNPSRLYLIYDSKTTNAVWDGAATWNREHVWPDSKLGSAPTGEPHNLRASTVSVNSSRGNLAFVEGSGSYGRVGSGWYPGDTHKGDVARIILYMHVRHGLSISSGVIGDLNMFLRWHMEDPVDDFEINRNNVIYSYVNNRNPFIDHPEFAQLIWGTPSARQEMIRDIEPFPFDLVNEIIILQPVHYYEPKNPFMNFIQ